MKRVAIVYLATLAVMFTFGKELVLYTFAIGFAGLVFRLVTYVVLVLPFIVLFVWIIVKAYKDKEKITDVLKFMIVLIIPLLLIFGSGFMMRFEVINTARDLFTKTKTVQEVGYLTYSHNSKNVRSNGHYMLVFYENEEPVPYTQKMYMRVSKLEKWYDSQGRQIFPKSLIGYDKIMATKHMGLKVNVTYYPNSNTRTATGILEAIE